MQYRFTFGNLSGPPPVVLAGDDRLALHHEVLVAVELHHVSGFVRPGALLVPVLRHAWLVAVHLCKSAIEVVTCDFGFGGVTRTCAVGERGLPVPAGQAGGVTGPGQAKPWITTEHRPSSYFPRHYRHLEVCREDVADLSALHTCEK